jgi:hypothetical protein
MSIPPAAAPVQNIASVALTREQLYDIVWSEPIRTVAARYGISDRGLAKVCTRLHVPVPGRGYWQQKAVGKKVRQPPLKPRPASTPPNEREVTLSPRDSTARKARISQAVAEQRALESAPEHLIQVPGELTDPHPLVERTAQALQRRKADERGLLHPSLKRSMDVHVSKASVNRALRILNALVKALESRGYAITFPLEGPRRTAVTIDGEEMGVSLEEKVDASVIPEPKSALSRRPEYSFFRPTPRYRYTPTGQLTLRITDRDLRNVRRAWRDGRRQTVERQLNRFIIGLVAAAGEKKAERQRAEDAQKAHEQWEREEAERQRRRWEQERKIRLLEQDLALLAKSHRVREYVGAIRAAAAAAGESAIDPESDLGRWLDWATRYADRLDPSLTLKPPRDPWEVLG